MLDNIHVILSVNEVEVTRRTGDDTEFDDPAAFVTDAVCDTVMGLNKIDKLKGVKVKTGCGEGDNLDATHID